MITCADRFRIVTNGLRYRVERLEWRGILWWRRQVWRPIGIEFVRYPDAVDRLRSEVAELLKPEPHGWTPVEPGREPQDNGKETPCNTPS
jgi:hypothetical protein